MRRALYILCGMIAGLIGFTVAHWILLLISLPSSVWFGPEYLLFPLGSAFIACATVLAEILLNNPTRHKRNWELLPSLLSKAALLGLAGGTFASIFVSMPIKLGWVSSTSTWIQLFKMLGWIAIGLAAGIADGYSWKTRKVESRLKLRFWQSVMLGSLAGLIAFLVSLALQEAIPSLSTFSELFGFIALGFSTGTLLQWLATGSTRFALRTGAGFEVPTYEANQVRESHSRLIIDNSPNREYLMLSCDPIELTGEGDRREEPFRKVDDSNEIQEGMSITLPQKGTVIIGSDTRIANIFVSILPKKAATITVKNREAFIEVHESECVEIGFRKLSKSSSERVRQEKLVHNQVITLKHPENKSNSKARFVRFVFYDRFLSPDN